MWLIRSVRRHWLRWTIGAVAVVAAVVVGGPFVFFHFVEGPAPAPLRLSDGPTRSAASSSSTSTGALDAVWKVASGSQAGHRVQETVFGQSHTAVGRTSAVTGRSGSLIQVNASIPITFADWNISNPSGGPATTADHGILEVLINLAHS